LVHFTVFCYTLWTFDIVRGNFSRFGILYWEKSGKPWSKGWDSPEAVPTSSDFQCHFQ
jgi:hypothetical protein